MTAPVTREPASDKIAMTAPATQTRTAAEWVVRVTMPGSYSLETLPEPNDARVRMRVTLPARFAVIPFSGLTGPDEAAAKTAELSAWMQHRLFAMPVPLLSLNTIRRKAHVSPERQALQRTSDGPNVSE